jgi:hypothetical protein
MLERIEHAINTLAPADNVAWAEHCKICLQTSAKPAFECVGTTTKGCGYMICAPCMPSYLLTVNMPVDTTPNANTGALDSVECAMCRRLGSIKAKNATQYNRVDAVNAE